MFDSYPSNPISTVFFGYYEPKLYSILERLQPGMGTTTKFLFKESRYWSSKLFPCLINLCVHLYFSINKESNLISNYFLEYLFIEYMANNDAMIQNQATSMMNLDNQVVRLLMSLKINLKNTSK